MSEDEGLPTPDLRNISMNLLLEEMRKNPRAPQEFVKFYEALMAIQELQKVLKKHGNKPFPLTADAVDAYLDLAVETVIPVAHLALNAHIYARGSESTLELIQVRLRDLEKLEAERRKSQNQQ